MLAEGQSLRASHLLVLGPLGRRLRLLGLLIAAAAHDTQCAQIRQPLSRSRSRISGHGLDEV